MAGNPSDVRNVRRDYRYGMGLRQKTLTGLEPMPETEREKVARQRDESMTDARNAYTLRSKTEWILIARMYHYTLLMMESAGTNDFGKWYAAWGRTSRKLDALSNR